MTKMKPRKSMNLREYFNINQILARSKIESRQYKIILYVITNKGYDSLLYIWQTNLQLNGQTQHGM